MLTGLSKAAIPACLAYVNQNQNNTDPYALHPWNWVSDQGRRSDAALCWKDSYHVRLYQQPNPDYNPLYGYITIAAAHQDQDDNEIPQSGPHFVCLDHQYGWPETAAHNVTTTWQFMFGTTGVRENAVFINNKETYHTEDNHHYGSDGKATLIKVCVDNNLNVLQAAPPPRWPTRATSSSPTR